MASAKRIPAIGLIGALLLGGSALAQELKPPTIPPTIPPRRAEPRFTQPLRVPRLLPAADDVGSVPIAPALRDLAAALADPSYARREAAMQSLTVGVWDVSQICSLLSEPLASEQRYRLLTVLHAQLAAPRGAVGIRMEWHGPQGNRPGAVEIIDLEPGLPAEEVLRIGDHVTHIDGQPLNHRSDLIVLVQSKKPGESVVLTVSRAQHDERGDLLVDDEGRVGRRAIELTIRLGDAHKLLDPRTGRPLRGSDVEVARQRESRLAIARYAPRPVVVDVLGGEESGLVPVRSRTPITDEEIDAYPLILQLLRQKDRIATGRAADNAGRRRQWQLQLDRLNEMSARPGLTEREVELYRRVAQRYAELMQ